MQVAWTDPALDDLEAIRGYYLNEIRSPHAAFHVASAIRDAGNALDLFPKRGQQQDDGTYEFPVLSYPQYRLIYDVLDAENVVEILHVEITITGTPRPAAWE